MSKGSVPCPYFQWGRWKKERDKLSLPFHNLPNAISSLLATEVVSFLTYKIFSCIIFMSFVIFQGRKLILSSRNEVSGYLAMPVLSASYINQKKKIHCYCYISLSVLILLVEFFSLFISIQWEIIYPRSNIFPANCQHCYNFPSFLFFHPHLLQSLCIDRWRWDSRALPGLWIQSWLSGHAIPARNWPGTIQAQPSLFSLHGCWKPLAEQPCSGGWKASSDFLAMFISDQFIAICSCANSAFCFNSSSPSFVFASLLYL